MTHGLASRAIGISRFGLTSPDGPRLARFYQIAFDARLVTYERCDGLQGGWRTTLAIGDEFVEILQFDERGQNYPPELMPFDARFQHFAIVVSDMARAYQRLGEASDWRPITTAAPQRLPDTSGGVTAFKFRDPDGHPLELLEFAVGRTPKVWQTTASMKRNTSPFLGVDHSAICVLDVGRSIDFYTRQGMQVITRSLNRGIAQQVLDGVDDPVVDVVALEFASRPTPHLELLHYREPGAGGLPSDLSQRRDWHINDTVASRIVFDVDGGAGLDRDPDGHYLQWGFGKTDADSVR